MPMTAVVSFRMEYLIYDLPYFMLAHGIFVAEKKKKIAMVAFVFAHFVFVSDARSRFFLYSRRYKS